MSRTILFSSPTNPLIEDKAAVNPHLIKAATKLAKTCPGLPCTKQTRAWGLRRELSSLFIPWGRRDAGGDSKELSHWPGCSGRGDAARHMERGCAWWGKELEWSHLSVMYCRHPNASLGPQLPLQPSSMLPVPTTLPNAPIRHPSSYFFSASPGQAVFEAFHGTPHIYSSQQPSEIGITVTHVL